MNFSTSFNFNIPKSIWLVLMIILYPLISLSQVISSDPPLPTDTDAVTVQFNATGTALEGYSGDLYAHTGVLLTSNNIWQNVIGSWGNNTTQPKLTRLSANTYELVITPNIREFYNVPGDEIIEKMAFVFRASSNSPQSADLFIDVYESGTLSVSITNPPKLEPIVEFGEVLTIQASAIEATSITLYINNVEVMTEPSTELEYIFDSAEEGYGTFWLKASAAGEGGSVYDSTYIFVRPEPTVETLPNGLIPGINYIDDTTVTLVLHDPPAAKDYVFAVGDFNNWTVGEDSYMKVTPDGTHFWISLSDLTADTEYGFQYFIDNELLLADPYTHKILHPNDDQWIESTTYPNLKPYPDGKTFGIVSIMHPGKPSFNWEATGYTAPAKEDLVIYELLVRDFVETSAIKTVMDSLDYLQNLGVNAIELMPFNEFEGNNSWGYNPSFYFATDKAYGTREDYKMFIDECHKRGMAVIMDIVLNHSFSLSPFVRMYFDEDAGEWGQPTAENPWYLQSCPHQPWCWGYTFDQNSPYTHELFNRITEYWLTEFKVDGFRFDFTKGFTNVQTGNQGSNYDAARIANLKRIADHVWSVKPNAFVILEHLTDNSEEKELAEYGMMLWGNMTYNYQEASMGWLSQSDFSWASYKNRGWTKPHLIAYMESHDEERMMFKNINYGNSNGEYNIKETGIALRRAELAATFYFPIPGPKMIWQFGELGYDYSINHCPNGSINESCRVDPKPIRWDYYDDWKRKRLYDVYSMLIELKKEHDVFRTTDYSMALSGANKRIQLNHATNNVTIIGNFGTTPSNFSPGFQQTGTWHEFFSRETLEVTDVNAPVSLQPGEYRIYSTTAFPDHGLNLGTDDQPETGKNWLNVFPNPSEQGFHFNMNANREYHLRILNMQGQVIFEQKSAFSPENSTFYWDNTLANGQKAAAGTYFYQVYSGEEMVSGKIMLQGRNQ